jgi:hypothetical protein
MGRLVALLAVGVVLTIALGCGSKRTYRTSEGQVTVTRKGEKVTVESKEGKVEVQGDRESATITAEGGKTTVKVNQGASEQEVGIPFYPGAKATQTAAVSGQEAGSFTQVMLTTPDSVDQVKAFYQKQFPKAETAMDMQSPSGRMVHMSVKEGELQKVIQINRDNNAKETQILLYRARKSD